MVADLFRRVTDFSPDQIEAFWSGLSRETRPTYALRSMMRRWHHFFTGQLYSSSAVGHQTIQQEYAKLGADEFLQRMFMCTNDRAFVNTGKSMMGLCEVQVRAGDVITVFPEAETPFVLRSTSLLGDRHAGCDKIS